MNTFLYSLLYTSIFSALVPIGVFLVKRSRGYIVTIFILSVVLFLFEVTYRIMVLYGYRGFYIPNAYSILQFLVLSYFFTQILFNRKLIYATTALYSALYFLFFVLGLDHFNDFQSRLRAVENVVLLTYCTLYYRQLITTLPAKNVWQYAPFWINTAVFYYFGLNLFLFIIANYVFTNLPAEAGMTVWGFHNINNIVKNILFAVGIYYVGKREMEK